MVRPQLRPLDGLDLLQVVGSRLAGFHAEGPLRIGAQDLERDELRSGELIRRALVVCAAKALPGQIRPTA